MKVIINYYFYIIFIISLAIGNISIANELVMIKRFSTDYCSLFPNGTSTNKNLWRHCCIEHDKAYWKGGTKKERKAADEALEKCVASVGQPGIGALMRMGVYMGGSPYWNTSFRWGYGWPYGRGYKALTKSELAKVKLMARSLEPNFNQSSPIVPIITPALKLLNNFNQYQIALVSLDKGQEYCDIINVYRKNNNLVIKFKYRGISKLTLNEKHLFASGSYPITLPGIGTSQVDVQLKYNLDGTANGYWTNFGFNNEFNIIKKKHKPVLSEILNQWIENSNQYQIALVSLDKGQEYCDILNIRREEEDIVIKFKYRGITKLTFTEFDENNAIIVGSYPITLRILGTFTVLVQLEVNADGTANGYWHNMGFQNQFNIIKKNYT